MKFKLHSKFKPKGDQPKAITSLWDGLQKGYQNQTLLGVTGSGKTFTVANIIEKIQKPTLIISHNKVLAAQLYSEFKQFFPQNAVHFFVSYYDYYQPEAYLPQTDTYIEKDTKINEEIDRMRHEATHSLLTRKDVIVIASVSCIYNIGSKENYQNQHVTVKQGETKVLGLFLKELTALLYQRNDFDFTRGRIRLKGDVLEIYPSYETNTIRIEFLGNTIEKISQVDSLTGQKISELNEVAIYPAKHFISPAYMMEKAFSEINIDLEKQYRTFKKSGKELYAERIKQRTNFDLEMLKETGFCSGVENYSRYFDGRKPGQTPYSLIEYFPTDYLLVVDESHMTLPQIRGMYFGDRSRKQTLVDFGFRLPSCLDNRPLKYPEFEQKINQAIYLSATPAEEEIKKSSQIVEQIIRPTGLVDPEIEVRKTENQIDNLIDEIKKRVKNHQRALVTTLTIRLAEELTEFLAEKGIKVTYLHHQVDTLERSEILRDLRLGKYDVLVGINLLREGLDLPEVSLVAILDADKESFLRSDVALVQTIGRAARHLEGKVIMYADRVSRSMEKAIDETARRRKIQEKYNLKHHILPQTIQKAILESMLQTQVPEPEPDYLKIPPSEINRVTNELTAKMNLAAKNLEFEQAAKYRDQIKRLKEPPRP